MYRHVLLAIFSALLIAGLVLFGYLERASIPMFSPQGPIALGERDVIFITFLVCCLIIVPVYIMLFSFAYLYQAGHPRSRRHYFPDWDYHSTAAEIMWWLIPAAIIFFLSILSYLSTNALDPYKPLPGKAEEIQVVALNWKWLFIYPKEHIASVNSLIIPVNTPVHLELTSDAPVNSFWVPALAGQIMVMPGMATQLYLEANSAGSFAGASANISGQGFSGMAFSVRAVEKEAYDSWVASLSKATSTLNAHTYQQLAAPSQEPSS